MSEVKVELSALSERLMRKHLEWMTRYEMCRSWGELFPPGSPTRLRPMVLHLISVRYRRAAERAVALGASDKQEG